MKEANDLHLYVKEILLRWSLYYMSMDFTNAAQSNRNL